MDDLRSTLSGQPQRNAACALVATAAGGGWSDFWDTVTGSQTAAALRLTIGQALIVTAGLGWIQREGGAVEEIRPGDVVWFRPGEKHWHGASPTTAMTHIAIQEGLDGKMVDWMEKVTDTQYSK